MLATMNGFLPHESGNGRSLLLVGNTVSKITHRIHEVALTGWKEPGQHGKECGCRSVVRIEVLWCCVRKLEVYVTGRDAH